MIRTPLLPGEDAVVGIGGLSGSFFRHGIDIVLERGRQVGGVEVKAAATVTGADFRGLRKLATTAGRRFAAGVVLYDGEATVTFGERLYAAPVSLLWEGRRM